jgi:CubicO group peptidase (beta-lactamase class C family)
MRTVIVALLLVASAGVSAQGSRGLWLDDQIVAGEAGTAMHEYLTRFEPYGWHGAVLVAQRDTVLLHGAYGVANPVTGRKNTTGTALSTGSVTKQFTAAAIMLMAQDFRISLDNSIEYYLPDVPEDKRAITIHHLLTHTAGLAPSYGPDQEEIGRDEFVRRVLSQPLVAPVGDHYEYSNAGYSLLAAIVEVVSGMKYEVYLRDTFFKPALMRLSGLHEPLWRDEELAHSHNAELGYPTPVERPENAWNLTGSGGILSTPGDMYRWFQFLHSDQVFNDETRRLMFTPHVKEDPGGESYYGYGWVIQESRTGDTVIWHNGGAMPHGWSCAVYYYKQAEALFIAFSNAPYDGRLPVDDIAVNLSAILFGDRKVTMPPAVMTSFDLATLDQYTGTYSAGDTAFQVVAATDRLLLQPQDQAGCDILFPSGFAARLPKYNELTRQLIELLADGKYAEAAEASSFQGGDEAVTMLREWWTSHDELGDFTGIEIIGTVATGGAHTHFKLDFADGSVFCEAAWMPPGRCMGIGEAPPPRKDLLPTAADRFSGYSLAGEITRAEFQDGNMTVVSPGGSFTAERQ